MKIWFSFLGQTLNLLGYSRKKQGALENTFLKNPRMFLFLKFHVLFLWYPWKYHILSPTPLFVFFWDCPLNTEVMCIECLRHQWDTRESFYHQSSRFHQLIWERLQIFFHKFFWFATRSFSDFKDFQPNTHESRQGMTCISPTMLSKSVLPTVSHKIFETISSFRVK